MNADTLKPPFFVIEGCDLRLAESIQEVILMVEAEDLTDQMIYDSEGRKMSFSVAESKN